MMRALGALASGAWRLRRTAAGTGIVALQREPWRAALATQAGEAALANARAPFGHSVVYQQPTAQAALQLIDSLPSAHAQYPSLLAAAVYRAHWLMADRSDALERAAAAELVRRLWRCLSALDGNGLAKLLLAAAAMESLTGKQLRAWQAAYQAWLARDGARLPRNSRLSILEAAARLSRTSGLRLPGRMLGGHLGYLCRPPVLAHLRLPHLAALCWHARELGFRLTAEQHAALAAAAGQKASQEFSGSAVTSLLRCWADMEQEHRTWVAESVRKQQLAKSNMYPPHLLQAEGLVAAAAEREPISGYPGEEVMRVLVAAVHAHCGELGSWALGQILGALGQLCYVPSREQLAGITAAFEPKLRSAEQARETTAALSSLARLGFDPGEKFAAACMRVVEADGGRDQLLLSNCAWALSLLKRCPLERWQALLALLRWEDLSDPGRQSVHWLTSFLLVREQHGDGAVPLPAGLLQRAVEQVQTRTHAALRSRPEPGLLTAVTAEVLKAVGGSGYDVREVYWLEEPCSGRPLVLDVAVPALKFGVQLSRPSEVSRNTGVPLGLASILPRLARLAGWEVVVLPQEVLAAGKERRDVRALVRAVQAFLLQRTRLPQLLAGAGSAGAD